MNEQIKQLTRQALDECQAHDIKMIHAQAMDKYGIVEIPQCFSERFAELIVKECIELCDGNHEHKNHTDTLFSKGVTTGIQLSQQAIKTHFEIKE
jgi:hypothetical protein